MNGLEIRNLLFTAGEFRVSIDTLDVLDKDYFIIMGHTGSGKSLLLKAVAGLLSPEAGMIKVKDKDVTLLEPRTRNIGYVPQNSGLFPHLNVRKNLEFPLRLKQTSEEEITSAVDEAAESLKIRDLLTRSPKNLSGGERQKVALARAFLCRPDILLLDEPVSALDGKSRIEIYSVLKQTHKAYGITTLHVCHNTGEAREMGDNMAVMKNGSITDSGSTGEVLDRIEAEDLEEVKSE